MSDEESKSVRDRMAELQDDGLIIAPPPVAEVDPAPLGYIEVRAVKWRMLDGFAIRDGFEIGTRPRTEADGTAEYVIFKTPPPAQHKAETVEWPTWGEARSVDPRVATRHTDPPGPGDFGGAGWRTARYQAAQEENRRNSS
jgi:hypothetical protein